MITRDGKNIFVSDKKGNVFLHTYQNGNLKSSLILEGNLPISDLSLSANETMLAIAQFSSASIYDLTSGVIIAKQDKIKGRIKTIQWDPSGEMLSLGLVSGGIYVWRVFESSEKSIEIYDAESVTPIVGIAFLPSAEAMFTASRQGEVKLWRLLSADEKLGFYDPNAAIDKDLKASYFKDVAVLNTEIETIWINRNKLYVACADGMIHIWKIRGLKLLGSFRADLRGVLSASSVSNSEFFVSSGREQNMKVWCPAKIQPTVADFGEPLKVLSAEGVELTQTSQNNDLKPIYQSGVFSGTINLIKIGSKSQVLWAYEKTGNLLRFDLNKLELKGMCNAGS